MSGTVWNPPTSPAVGQTYVFQGITWVWNGTAWINAGTGANAGIIVSPTPPASPAIGQGWWNTEDGQLYLWINGAWVVAVNPPIPDAQAPGFTLNQPVINQPAIMGQTDGAAIPAGQIGETITLIVSNAVAVPNRTATALGSIAVPAGVWKIYGSVGVIDANANMTNFSTWYNPSGQGSNVPPLYYRSTISIAGTMSGAALPMRTALANQAGNETYTMFCYVDGSSPNASATGYIQATRIA